MIDDTVGSDIVKEQYTVTFPASTSGGDDSQPVTIHIIDDSTTETEEGFFLFITNYTSLDQGYSIHASDDVIFGNRVALVRIYDNGNEFDCEYDLSMCHVTAVSAVAYLAKGGMDPTYLTCY